MRDIIRETASKEINELRQALELEATLRAESDKKIIVKEDGLPQEFFAASPHPEALDDTWGVD